MKKNEAEQQAFELQTIIGTPFKSKLRGTIYNVVSVTSFIHPPQSENYHVFIAFSNLNEVTTIVEYSDYFFKHYERVEN